MNCRNDYPEMLALEPRIMFDGALVVDAIDTALNYKVDNVEADLENDITSPLSVKRIIFIDGNISTSSSFDNSLDATSEVFKLDSDLDGIQQITGYLSGRQGIESIHIVSHGSEGQINVGNTVLNSENLASYSEDLAGIGGALSSDGDILLYGCNVANATGRDFITSLSGVTGADVAASNNQTGSIGAGGDWLLEVESGSIESDISFFRENSGFSGLLTTPSVSDGGRTGYLKDTEAVVAAPGMIITNGGDYGGGGSLTVAVTSVDTSETLSLEKVLTASTVSNVVSVVGSTLYLGSGDGSNVIGSIDSTHNGESGNNLKINFLSDSFRNASFETGDLTGWTTDTVNQINIGTDSIAGIPTPDDTTNPVDGGRGGNTGGGDVGDGDAWDTKGTWTAGIKTNSKTHGSYSLQLKSDSMNSVNGFDVIHGPSVYSDIFEGETGQAISFDWRALSGGDAYDVFGYIVNTDTNASTIILNQTGEGTDDTAWAKANVTIPLTGNYRFVFVSGTYDYTGGKLLGASLYIDNIQVFNAVDDTIVTQVANLITYETEDTTLTKADRVARTLTFTAEDADGNASNNTAVIYEDFPEEAPTLQAPRAKTVAGIDLPASIIKINRDGLQTFVRATNAEGAFGNQVAEIGSDANDIVATSRNDSPKPVPSEPVVPSFNVANMPLFNSSNPNDGGVSVLNGINNPEIGSLGRISFAIPIDAFAKSNNDTMVSLKASQSGDRALPSWLKFDAVAGKFEGEIPEDFEGSIEVVVTATDQNGNEVTTTFVIEKDISAPGESGGEQSELSPSDVKKQIIAAKKQAFSHSSFSQQLLLSKSSGKSLDPLELLNATQQIKAVS